ncbi:hypothetical protein [Variovorax sp. RA8]|uniref:hypothetical protein n=1 Tax=Variovorax sp. (strain JCM 16519 / RA8) TaxID=662548 RepID=UPI0013A54AD6|nr:hypothetical protein [Variovorax sp. RA8]
MSFDESDRAEKAAASTLFFAEADEHEGLELKVGYLEFLWMPPGAAAEADKLRVLMNEYPREEVERDICLVLDASGWRPHLVACVALLCGHTTPKMLWYLWRAIQADSWVAPQLVATASLVDPEFANKAEWVLLSTRLQPKAAGALGAMLAERLGPEDELPGDVDKAVQRGSAHPDDPAGIARTWKQSVLRAFRPFEGNR